MVIFLHNFRLIYAIFSHFHNSIHFRLTALHRHFPTNSTASARFFSIFSLYLCEKSAASGRAIQKI